MTVEGGMPVGAEDFQQRVEPRQAGGAALDQRRMQLGRPAQRVPRTDATFGVESFGMQQRQPGQQHRVQPVAFGVVGVVGPQVRRPLRRDQDHLGAFAQEPGRQRHPGVAGRLHHHREIFGSKARRYTVPQPLKVRGGVAEPVAGPDQLAARVDQAGLVRDTDGLWTWPDRPWLPLAYSLGASRG